MNFSHNDYISKHGEQLKIDDGVGTVLLVKLIFSARSI